MSYLSQGTVCLIVGIVLIPVVGLGLIVVALSIIMLAIGGSAEQPGLHASRCGWLGHDWRDNMAPTLPGVRCRNCLKIKGQPGSGYVPVQAVYYPPPPGYGAPPMTPGYPPPGYGPAAYPAPGYAPAPIMAPPPPAAHQAAFAPPVQQLLCPACRSPVQAGMAFCPWCNRPFA